jgi:bifunctional non-homologous end joining protein LigD
MGTRIESVDLVYSDLSIGGNSNKEYHLQLEKNGSGYLVNFQFGRIGSHLKTGTKTPVSLPLAEAKAIFNDILNEKLGKGYDRPKGTNGHSTKAPIQQKVVQSTRTSYPAELLEEIGQEKALELANDNRYLLQKKYDGHRKQIQKTKTQILTYNKKGELVPFNGSPSAADFLSLPGTFILDGEQIGNHFYAFDIFEVDGVDLATRSYSERFKLLKVLINNLKFVKLAETFGPDSSEKSSAFMNYVEQRAEGVVFKLKSAPYRAGRNGQTTQEV